MVSIKSIRIKKRNNNKIKSSMKKKNSKRSLRHFKVKWSPDIKHIERKSTKNTKRKSLKTRKAKTSTILLKISSKKTKKYTGIIYARPYVSECSILNLINKGNKEMKLVIDMKEKKILKIINDDFHIKGTGNTRIRMVCTFGDIIWKINGFKVCKKCYFEGYDMRWMENIMEMNKHIHDTHNLSKYR